MRPGFLLKPAATSADMVLALYKGARIVPGRYVKEPHVARQAPEERNSVSNEHGHAGNNEALNESRAQEPLNRDPPVDVEVSCTTGGELRNDRRRRPGHLFHHGSDSRGQIHGAITQHYYALVTIRPNLKGQNLIRSPFGRAMKPSTLVPANTDTVIVATRSPSATPLPGRG